MKFFSRNFFRISIIALVIIGFAFSVGCQKKAVKTADLVYVNWAEGVAYTHLAKVVLEEQMGYIVTITAADAGPSYTSVAQGSKDAFMETWLPVLHKDYVERYKEDIIDLGKVFRGTQSGWVVPTYMDIENISELRNADVKKALDGKITGIDAGAGVMRTSEEVIKEYDLDYELVASSGPAMTAALKDAYKDEKAIVVTGWKPHWMFGEWDLKFLKQDEKVMWKQGDIHIMGRKDLREDKPELAEFLNNMSFTDAQLSDLMLKVKKSDMDVEQVAREWMNDNMDLINSWIPSE